MILQALCGYYDRLAASADEGVAMPGWSKCDVYASITLDTEGNVVRVLPELDKNTNKPPKKMVVPQKPNSRSGSKPNAAFLWETPEFLFGIYRKKDKVTKKELDELDEKGSLYRFAASCEKHKEILQNTDDVGAQAILEFFEKRKRGSIEYPGVDTSLLSGKQYVVFRLEGENSYIHERPAIRVAWEGKSLPANEKAETMQCLITGEHAAIAVLHGEISGFGQKGVKVVSYNQNSFESYRKSQGANAPVSEFAAFRYVTALNALIADPRHIVRMADTKVVFWAERDAAVEENFLHALFGGKADEGTVPDERSARKISALLSTVRSGKAPGTPDIADNVTFHILGISAAKTRLVVRFFHSDTFGNLLDRIGQHYRDMEIVGASWEMDKLIKPFGLLIETAVARKSENIPPTLEGALMRSIITGAAYPYGLYNAILARIRADKAINYARAGILKGFLNRSDRASHEKERMTVALNPEETNQGYLLGRLFAVLEKAQYDALGKVNATIVDKYLNSALATPQTVFPVLLALFEKHVSKSEKYYAKQLVQQIAGELPSGGFPQTLNAEDQGRFLIGYYHQRQDFFKGKPQEADDNTTDGGNENE
ncbi:type I-C CRISPR-associated protein Cas8c/Csd1 [Clostridia bacterium]|nr:type I-C CRISPR-associated protein Cas8c/Csd1 [Clostridia bacterium]